MTGPVVPQPVELAMEAVLGAWRGPEGLQDRLLARLLNVAEELECVEETLATVVYASCDAIAAVWPDGDTVLVPVGCESPDALVAGDTKGQGALLADRVLVALSNGDTAYACDLLGAPPRVPGRVNPVLAHAAMAATDRMRVVLRAVVSQ